MKADNGDDDHDELYSLTVSSPGGKAFEIISYVIDDSLDWHFKKWTKYSECWSAHDNSVYSKDELDEKYSYKNGASTKYDGGLMPIRTNVAVSNLDTVMQWWGANMAGVVSQNSDFYDATTQVLKDGNSHCRHTSLGLQFYDDTMKTEIRFVENPSAYTGDYSVTDFVTYMEGVNSEYTSANEGWSAWFDRHR